MSKAEPDGSFWKSLGGILTGIAAVMTAVGGLIGVWYQLPAKTAPPPLEVTLEDPMQALPEIGVAAPDHGSSQQSPITRPASPPTGGIEVGEAVLAEWQGDGCLYPGNVREIKDGRYHVYFGFDEQVWIAPEGVVKRVTPTAANVSPGARVYAEVEDVRTRWIPSTVRDVRDGRYYLVFDESAECRPRGKRHVWAGVDGIVLSD